MQSRQEMLLLDDFEEPMRNSLRDWRMALRTPTAYRVGNRTVRIQTQFIALVVFIGLVLLLIFYYYTKQDASYHSHHWVPQARTFNRTYPFSTPIKSGGLVSFRIAIVADLDTDSKVENKKNLWKSYLKKGYLSYSPSLNTVVVTWDTKPPLILSSSYALKGRGMELSELVVFDGRLLTFDDRSGMVYEIVDDKVVPWLVLIDGNGKATKGFKSEWATVRGEVLYVGSMGKEWTTPGGQFMSYDPMWVKAINIHGEVRHEMWVDQYKKIRKSIGIDWPGYMIHESGAWSPHHNRWVFLPRRCSQESYNETKDESKGCNYLITADPNFSDRKVTLVGKPIPTHGFSSFKFIPGSDDDAIVALRTMEYQGTTSTFISAFRMNGDMLMEETFVSNVKYEGIEFI
ncbi:apyrase [Arctopsyche grandis]|uniref:apyrase n=1 Tax=Arctopsyche grandis TaxID=121162 RepID=UPI00406D6753